MPQAAIPDYLKAHLNYQNIAPGHIFSLYFEIWQDNWSKLDQDKESALISPSHRRNLSPVTLDTPICRDCTKITPSFPRSAWECIPRRSASRNKTQSVCTGIPTQSVGTIK